MKIFLIGGTGFLGTFLRPKLRENGHEITALARNKEKAAALESLEIQTITGNLLHPEFFLEKIPHQDAVISIAMPEVRPGRLSQKRLRKMQKETEMLFSTPVAIAEKCRSPLIVTLGTSFTTRG